MAFTLVERHWRKLLLLCLLIHLAGFNGQWRVERDSALYLSTGRSLAEGHGYAYRDQPNRLIFPGLPFLIDAVFRLFHTQSPFPLLVLMLLMGWATLALVYRLFYLHGGHGLGIIMTLGVGLTRLFYRYCFEILSDLPFLLGVTAFLAGYEAILFHRTANRSAPGDLRSGSGARWYDYALLVCGLALAISMRVVVWVLLGAIVVSVLWRIIRRQVSRLELTVGAIVLLAVALFYLIDPRAHGPRAGQRVQNYEGTLLVMLKRGSEGLTQVLKANLTDLFPKGALIKALFGCGLWPVINAIIGGVLVGLGVGLLKRRVLWGLLVLFTVVMLLLFKPLDRYFLPVIPLLVFAWWNFIVWLNRRLPLHVGNLVFLALFFGGLGTNLSRIGEMVVEQRRVPFLLHYHDGRYASLNEVARWLGRQTQEHDWILVSSTHGRILTYKAHRKAFEATEKPPAEVGPPHLFILTGPSWDDTKEGHKKEQRLKEAGRHERDRMREWLDIMHMRRGALVAGPFKGTLDPEPWTLYRLEPITASNLGSARKSE